MTSVCGTVSLDEIQRSIHDSLPTLYTQYDDKNFSKLKVTILQIFNLRILSISDLTRSTRPKKPRRCPEPKRRAQLKRANEEHSITLASFRHRLLAFLTNLCTHYPEHYNDLILNV
jgi:hypothetical protein